MNFFRSIKFKFTLWYLVVLGVLMGVLGTGLYLRLSYNLRQSLDNSLVVRADQLSHFRNILIAMSGGQFEEELGEVVILYFHSNGALVHLSSPARDLGLPITADMVDQVASGQSLFATVKAADGRELRAYLEPVLAEVYSLTPDSSDSATSPPSSTPAPSATLEIQTAVLLVGRPTEPVAQALVGVLHNLAIIIPLTLAVAAAGGLFLARRILRPVDEITEKARSIEESDLSQRIQVKTKDELGKLASTLNDMIGRLEKAFKRQRQFTSDASHELRAPLAIIEAESTLALQKDRPASAYRESLETVSQEAHHMSHIIEQLLTLARSDAGEERLFLKAIRLKYLIREVGSDAAILSQQKNLVLEVGRLEDLTVIGDDIRLRQLFLNLLDNAIRYTPSGGIVSLSARREGDMALVTISDTGVGIPKEDQPHIFERFYRVDKARSRDEGGSGLGLAIAKSIAEAHRGKIEVESEPGRGSSFHVYLPLRDEKRSA